MSRPQAELEISCLEETGEPPVLKNDIRQLIEETEAEIYFLPDWRDAWWQAYGRNWAASRRPVTFVAYGGGRLLAFLPFCIETVWVGLLPVRVARLAGVDTNFAVMTLPILDTVADRFLDRVLADLVGRFGCAAILLTPLSEASGSLEVIHGVAERSSAVSLILDRSDRGHTLMRLPETAEAFFANRSKSRRREHRRDVKKLTEEAELSNRTSTPQSVEADFETFMTLHTRQWEAAGKGGHFRDWSRAEPFYRLLLKDLSKENRAGIDEQRLGDALLSSQLRFSHGRKAYWWLNARSVDPRFQGFGLGRIGLVERVGDLIASGIRLVDAGTGEYEYKLSYGGELIPIHALVLCRNRPLSKLKVHCLLRWADALNLFYYRAWYLKIAPRLSRFGLKRRALWKSWIRTRL